MQYDLSHQAGVMTAVNGFVDWVLNLELNQSSFITHLCSLIPAFQIFDQMVLSTVHPFRLLKI